MDFGAQLGLYGTNYWSNIRETVEALDAGRWSSIWFPDHFMPPGNPDAGHGHALEAWTILSAIASITSRAKLGILATGNTYRNPALLAKMCASLDHVTDGRMVLGLGETPSLL